MENPGSLEALLEKEHQEIDAGIDAFVSASGNEAPTQKLLDAARALRRHIYLEEVMVFPALREAGLVAPVFVMLREHGEIWRSLDEIEAAVAAATDRASILAVCARLAEELERHNTKEERILYPRTDDVVTGEAAAELEQFLASGEMPNGWKCAQAEHQGAAPGTPNRS